MKTIFVLIFSLVQFCSLVQAQRIDSLLGVVAKGHKDIEEVRALNNLAIDLMRTDMSRASNYMYKTIELSKLIGSARYLTSGYSQLVTYYHNVGNTDSAVHILGILNNLSQSSTGNDKLVIDANYHATAGLYYKKTGNLKQSITHLKKSLALMEADGVKQNIAGQHLNLGNTYNLTGDYKNALTHLLKALKLFSEEQNLKGQSFCYQNISNSFVEMKQFKNALGYAQKSLAMKKSLDDKRGIGTAENGLGQIYDGLGKYEQALVHYNNAMNIASSLKLVTEQLKINYNIAKTYISKKDTAKAIQFFNLSREIARQLGDSTHVSTIQLDLAALQTKKQIEPLTDIFVAKNIAQIQASGQLAREASGYGRIAEMYEANQQYDKALEYTRKYHRYQDSINSTELQTQIKQIEEQYQVDQKEKEIVLLKKDQELKQTIIEKQRLYQTAGIILLALLVCIAVLATNRYRVVQRSRQLLEMEKMRNGIARDLHDDIGSTLTSINILSKVMLQQQHQEFSMQNNLMKIKEHSSSIMESMADIVWAINPHNDTVEKVIYKMKEFAAEVFEPLNIKYNFIVDCDFSNLTLTLEKRKDLYLIFKEAVNNAAKYSKCKEVNISLRHLEQSIQLEVSDNGDGFDEETVRLGNGIRNIRERAKNMLASLSYNSKVGFGTDLQLSIPLT